QLDATAAPINIFRDEADLRPYQTVLPEVALDNLITPSAGNERTAYWMRRTAEQNLARADQADAQTLNQIIWFSVRGDHAPLPRIARLPAFDLMLIGLRREDLNVDEEKDWERANRKAGKSQVAKLDRGRSARDRD